MTHSVGDAAFIGKIVKKVGKAASKAVRQVAKPVAAVARSPIGKVAIGAARFVPGTGSAIGAAEKALQGVARGDSLTRIASAAALGAAPPGVAAAVAAGRRLAAGDNVVKTALVGVTSALPPGPARMGAEAAAAAVRAGKPAAALGAIKAALPPSARVGFDAALGALAQANSLPQTPMAAPNPLAGLWRQTRPITSRHPTVGIVRSALQRSPWLAARDTGAIARELGVPIVAVRDALRAGPVGLRWRPASRAGAAFLRRHAAIAPAALTLTDAGTLVPETHTLKSGEYPAALAAKYTGASGRWKEFPSANPGMKEVHNKDSSGKITWSGLSPWNVGQVVTIPPAWRGTAATPTAAPAAAVTTAAILKAKAALAAWSKTDGASSAGVSDYGTQLADLSPEWGPRDRFVAASFANWAKLTDKSGELTQALVSALDQWVEQKAAAAPLPTEPTIQTPPPMIPGLPPSPGAVTVPEQPATSPGQPTATAPSWPPLPPIEVIQPWLTPTEQPAPLPAPVATGPLPPPPLPVPAPAAPAPAPAATDKKSGGGAAIALALLAAGLASGVI